MCGIVGYKGSNNATRIIHEGLKKLEYRGYDSAGIAVAGNPEIYTEKKASEVSELDPEFQGDSGIGHTRWATHGGVNDTNAHPHRGPEGRIAVVHNGIIENYKELREELGEHRFRSETDTETIAVLLEEFLEDHDLEEAVRKTRERLEGSYAVAAVTQDGRIAAMRKNSPLVIGIGEDEYFLSSDVTPFLEHTDQAVFLEDGDHAVIDQELKLYRNGEKIQPNPETIDWDAEQASKAGHDHFMQKEIKEQPETAKKAVFQDRSDVKEALKMIKDADRIYFTGAGTASFAAMLGAKAFREKGLDTHAEQAHELEYRADEITDDDLIIAVSQSGETADLLSMLDAADAPVLAITNVVGSTLARNSEKTIYINAGPEIGVASTKAFTSQLVVLKLLAEAREQGLEDARSQLLETTSKIDQVLEENIDTVEGLAEKLDGKDSVFFIGRHRGHEIAREAALKLKELSYIHAEAFPGGEFKHGSLPLIEEGKHVVAFTTDDRTNTLSNAIEAKTRGAEITGVDTENREPYDNHIKIPQDPHREILEAVPFQLLAYKTALKRGNNPDKPRNLAKSVTVK